MRDRAPFVVGLLAIVAVVAWLLLRGDSAQQPKAPALSQATGSPAAKSAPAGPSLPTTNPPPSLPPTTGPTAEDTFTEEARDDAWANKTEAELMKRWKQVRGAKLESTECRQTQCRLVVTGAEAEVATSIADLEGPRGLHGFAENILLTSPSKAADGTITLRVYAKFDR